MNISLERLNNREKGNLPLSIGTALAIEAACGMPTLEGEPRLAPGETPAIHRYDTLWINVRTLYRNIIASLTSEDKKIVTPDDLYTVMLEELRVVESTITKATQGRCLVVYYHCSYSSLHRRFSRALLKEARTEKQKADRALESATLKIFLSEDPGVDLRRFDITIEAGAPATLMLTHLPIDLLSKPHFAKLTLLESHTGHIKRESEWSSKLTGKKEDLARIPFNRLTLQVFGDGTMFGSMPPKVKEEIIEIAQRDKWTTLTTREKMRYSLNSIYDPRVKTFFLSLLG